MGKVLNLLWVMDIAGMTLSGNLSYLTEYCLGLEQ